MPMLKDSFRTTNCIENVNSLLAQLIHNVRRWTNSSQRHRWVATALLDIEPRLRRVKRLSPSADAPASDTGRAESVSG